jgi:hypothetical protein
LDYAEGTPQTIKDIKENAKIYQRNVEPNTY